MEHWARLSRGHAARLRALTIGGVHRVAGAFPKAVYPSALAICSLLAACGSGREASSSIAVSAAPARQVIQVSSPALRAGHIVPQPYACAERVWLPLRWGTVPDHTGELVLYMGGFGKTRLLKPGVTLTPITSRMVIVGLEPSLRVLDVGRLPKHALGLTERGVPVCPRRAPGEKLFFKLYALPRARRVSRASVRSQSQIDILNRAAHDALAIGELTATYGRR